MLSQPKRRLRGFVLALSVLACAAQAVLSPSARGAPPTPAPAAGKAAGQDQAATKAKIHEALLAVRRARYALRKAKQGGDPDSVRRAEERLSEAKTRLKALRTELRESLRASAAEPAPSGPAQGKGGGSGKGR